MTRSSRDIKTWTLPVIKRCTIRGSPPIGICCNARYMAIICMRIWKSIWGRVSKIDIFGRKYYYGVIIDIGYSFHLAFMHTRKHIQFKNVAELILRHTNKVDTNFLWGLIRVSLRMCLNWYLDIAIKYAQIFFWGLFKLVRHWCGCCIFIKKSSS